MTEKNSNKNTWDDRLYDGNEEEDPVITMIRKTGCAQQHYNVQMCFSEYQDWRKCQEQTRLFQKCMLEYEKSRKST